MRGRAPRAPFGGVRRAPGACFVGLGLVLLALAGAAPACSGGGGGGGGANDDAGAGGDTTAPVDDASPIEIDVPSTPRAYRMGVAVTPAAPTAAAEDDAWTYAQGHGDVIAVRLDQGVPWEEMVAGGDTLPEGMEARVARIQNELESTRARRYLSVDLFNRTRTGIAPDSEGRALPDGVDLSTAGSQALRDAYTHYCLLLLDRLQPDYFSPVLDLNVYLDRRPSDYDAAVALYRSLREALKGARLATQVFPTWNLERLLGLGTEPPARDHLAALRMLDPNSDRLGLSLDPAGEFVALESIPSDYLQRIADTTTRPLVIAAAAYPSSGFQSGPIIFPSSEASQYNYLARLLDESERLQVDLLIWRFPYDVDGQLEALCPGRLANPNQPCEQADDFDALRPNAASGLLRADGHRKIAADLWNDFFARTLSTP